MSKGHRTCLRSLLVGLLFCLSGCHDPIYDTIASKAVSSRAPLTLKVSEDTSRYDWNLSGEIYVVAKPPQMAYLTSFETRLTRPDPTQSELVPWSQDGLDERAIKFLRHAYQPPSQVPDVRLSLKPGQCIGPQAFDVSMDGSRLIVIEAKGLALYKTQDGALVGHLKLPREIISSGQPIRAVRFAGKSNDILVASETDLFRISGKDKSVTRTKGCGEAISQWIVSDDDRSMIVRTESGKLFGGDPNLNFFAAYALGKELRFDAVSLSPDGRRIGVCLDGQPRTYFQDHFQVVDQFDYPEARLGTDVSISAGVFTEAWVDGDQVFYNVAGSEGQRQWSSYRMMWNPVRVSMCADTPNQNHFLVLGKRYSGRQEQVVLFDFGVVGRNNSLPTVLERMPLRMAHGRSGDRVAVFDQTGLRVIDREHWRTRGPIFPAEWVYQWVNEDKINVIEKLLAIVESQDRTAFGRSSEELRSIMINAIAQRWRYLDQNEPKSEVLARLEDWRREGSQLALICSALRHHHRAWNYRGSGTIDTVSGNSARLYRERIDKAMKEMDEAIAKGNPPMIALSYRVDMGLETGEELVDVDPICRLSSEMYPCELDPHVSVSFKLLPQWRGEPGDCISFALSTAKMFESPDGDILYSRMVSRLVPYLSWDDSVAWRSYDANRIRRGIEASIRRDLDDGDYPFLNWLQMRNRARTNLVADMLLEHLMASRAAYPTLVTEGSFSTYADLMYRDVDRIRRGGSNHQ